ncbi:hypothetical protein [Neobacillus sp. 114]|uniref:hypothetical protein n=1 Tax=Neobacillus sp. 114 TaxID=3048535 RepID=UPI0024C29881|nr:hypothetical protein [Neobacillus sp. 114]
MSEIGFRIDGHKNEFVLNEFGQKNVLADFGINLTEKYTKYYMEGLVDIITSFEQLSKLKAENVMLIDILSIVCSMFDYLLKTNGKNIRMLELGKFGLTAYFQAKTLKLFSDDNILFYCHKWGGSDQKSVNLLEISDTYDRFNGEMKSGGVSEQIIPLIGDSSKIIKTLQNDYFDCIFIKEERYGTLLSEIVQSIKKVKTGGLLIGYHCDCYFHQLPPHLQNKKYTDDEITEGGYHTGVIFALKELFDDHYEKPIRNSQIWRITVTKELKENILKEYCYRFERDTINQLIEVGHSIERGLNGLNTLNQTESHTLELLQQDIGMEISKCELTSTDLAYTAGYGALKKAIIAVKDKYVETMIDYKQSDDPKTKFNIEETRTLLNRWFQALYDFEKDLNK